MKKMFVTVSLVLAAMTAAPVHAKQPKSMFYDFQGQLIDGEVKTPTVLYTDRKQQVKFSRLLSLKKSFVPMLLQSSKERLFK